MIRTRLIQSRDELARTIARVQAKIVFAESCTGGLAAATMTQVSGISNYLCGSAVTYRPETKRCWLGIDAQTIARHSCESSQVVEKMAIGVLERTPEAIWSAAIVGHLEGECRVWISIQRRATTTGSALRQFELQESTREARQQEATIHLLDTLVDSIQSESSETDVE